MEEQKTTTAISQFMNMIREPEYEPLSREEEISTATLAKNGDKNARETLIKKNLRLVVKIALDFNKNNNSPLAFEDLVSAGNEGLIKAVDKYDCNEGTKFSTYSAWWIKQMIRREFQKQAYSISFSAGVANRISIAQKKKQKFEEQLGRAVEYNEFKEMDETKKKKKSSADRAYFNGYHAVSIDDIAFNEDTKTRGDTMCDERMNPAEVAEHFDTIADMMEKFEKVLNDTEKEILKCRMGFYGSPMTFNEIKNRIGTITFQRTQQIEAEAKYKLRIAMDE